MIFKIRCALIGFADALSSDSFGIAQVRAAGLMNRAVLDLCHSA